MTKGPTYQKSFAFALRIVNLSKYLQNEKKEFVLSRQVLQCGTRIGAFVREAEFAENKAGFAQKMRVALQLANETLYWLELLHFGEYIDQPSFESIHSDNQELVKLLVSIVKTIQETALHSSLETFHS